MYHYECKRVKVRRQTFWYLHEKKFDIVFLQETHSDKTIEKIWSSMWGKKIWFSHGNSQARGVAILFSKNISVMVHNIVTDKNGRYLLLYVTYEKQKFLLVNVYAPNMDDPQFCEEVCARIKSFTPDYCIMAGDFNFGLDPMLDRQGSITNNSKAAGVVASFLENLI